MPHIFSPDLGEEIRHRKYTLGQSHKTIRDEVPCSISTVSYHLSATTRAKTQARTKKRRATLSGNLDDRIHRFTSAKTGKKKRAGPRPLAETDHAKRRNPVERSVAFRIIKAHTGPPRSRAEERRAIREALDLISSDPRCYLTGDPIDFLNTPWHLDHVVPRSRGGKNGVANMGLTTAVANAAKGDMTVEEFQELCAKVLKHAGWRVHRPRS